MGRRLDEVYAVIDRMPYDQGEKTQLRYRARRYHQACGCALSGLFLTVSILACATGLVLADPFRWSLLAIGMVLTFVAGLLGKAIGIGWGRTRLLLMHRSLVRQLAT